MRALLAAVGVFTVATPLSAQQQAPSSATPTAPTSSTSTPPPSVTAAKFTVDTPLETIAADPAGKAALDATMPGITTHPMYEQFKSMSLKQLAPMSGGKITDEGLVKANDALAAVK